MKIIGIGLGSIGQRHFNNLHNNFDVDLIAYRYRNLDTKFITNSIYTTFTDLDEALEQKPDAAIITNPTSLHVPLATKLAKNGCHLFIEKPLSNTMDGVDTLIDIVDKKGLITLMGFHLRFHSCINVVKQLVYDNAIGDIYSASSTFGSCLTKWHPWEDYRQSYAARKDLGGGAILTNIHEIDYLYWIFGEVNRVFGCMSKKSKLEIDVEDNAEILMEFKNGVLANIHLDILNIPPRRGCNIVGEKGSIFWDFDNNRVGMYTDNRWKYITPDGNKDYTQAYIDEMKHFIDCINTKKKTINDIHEGKRVLEIALAIKKSSEEERWIRV